jgi:hypothetical protein
MGLFLCAEEQDGDQAAEEKSHYSCWYHTGTRPDLRESLQGSAAISRKFQPGEV